MFPGDNLSCRNRRTNYRLTVLSSLTTLFLPLVYLKFQHSNSIESPLETHCVIMSLFIITILVHTITLCTASYFPEMINNINLLSGILAPVLLTFILFPGLGWFVLLVWVIYFVKLTYHACRQLRQLYKEISSVSGLLNHAMLRFHACHNEQSTTNNHRHASLDFSIGILLTLMPLKYQSTNIAAPFETHRAIISIFVAVTLVYAVAVAIEDYLQTSYNSSIQRVIISKISLLCGSLSTVVLVLVIVPALGWFILLVWTFFLVNQIYDAWLNLYPLYRTISMFSYVFSRVFDLEAHRNQGRNGLPI